MTRGNWDVREHPLATVAVTFRWRFYPLAGEPRTKIKQMSYACRDG